MSAYSDYCAAEKAEGRKPLSPKEWSEARKNVGGGAPVPDAVPDESVATGHAEGFASEPRPSTNDQENDPEDRAVPEPAVMDRVVALDKAAKLRAEAAALEAEALGATPEDQKAKREQSAAERGVWVFHTESRFLSVVLESSSPYRQDGRHYSGHHVSADFSYGNWITRDQHLAEKLMETDDYQKGVVYLVDEAIQHAVVGIADGPRTSSTLSPRVRMRPAGALSAPLD